MSIEAIADGVERLARRTGAFGERPLSVLMIANPSAGGFTRRRVYRRRLAELEALLARAEAGKSGRSAPVDFALALTERPGHAAELARAFAEAPSTSPDGERLVVAAGGDGTSHEVLSALAVLDAERRGRVTVLRLPMGTGNDGSDGRDLQDALGRLVEPGGFIMTPCVRVVSADPSRPAHMAFNIASIGFDAYVAHLTNRLKSSMPGDSYKLLLDVMSVFYDRILKVVPMGVRAFGPDGRPVRELRRETLLVALGISGRRTYGSNKPILPDDDNACVIFQMSLFQKLIRKGPIARGLHRGLPMADLFTAERLEIDYDQKILAQVDGECWELGPSDFPLVMERSEPLVRTLRRADPAGAAGREP
ncbi:MAG TPA: diacylglycerol kinase family protein [Spirochaetales bacterium]|nr:diacylglycerol kinase family protein [Spirochaetales bacterium]